MSILENAIPLAVNTMYTVYMANRLYTDMQTPQVKMREIARDVMLCVAGPLCIISLLYGQLHIRALAHTFSAIGYFIDFYIDIFQDRSPKIRAMITFVLSMFYIYQAKGFYLAASRVTSIE